MSGEDQHSAAFDQHATGYCEAEVEWADRTGGVSDVGMGDEVAIFVRMDLSNAETGIGATGEGDGMGEGFAEGGIGMDANTGHAGAGGEDVS